MGIGAKLQLHSCKKSPRLNFLATGDFVPFMQLLRDTLLNSSTVTCTTTKLLHHSPQSTMTHPIPNPPQPADALSRRRSRHELRLEQIAIWGDAAASRTRPLPHNYPTLDMDLLTTTPPPPVRTGSLSMCHSRSADIFRRSGKQAAVARASLSVTRDRRDSIPRRQSVAAGDKVLVRKSGRIGRLKVEIKGGGSVPKGRQDDLERREKDEEEFRESNAKLPEREEGKGWKMGGVRMRAMAGLGRYRRSGGDTLGRRSSRKQVKSRRQARTDEDLS